MPSEPNHKFSKNVYFFFKKIRSAESVDHEVANRPYPIDICVENVALFWSLKCVIKKVRTTQYRGAENQWNEKVRLIECAKNVHEMCL